MRDGGREKRKRHESYNLHRNPESDLFSQAIVRVAVGQICHNEGFQAFQQSALETLSDIVIRYMLNIGKAAFSSANSAGRTAPNAFDIIHGIEDLHLGVGLPGAFNIDQCPLNSGVVKETLNYVYNSEEIPLAHPLHSFPISKRLKPSQSFMQSGDEPPYEHIPAWLPKFPDCLSLDQQEELTIEKSLSNLLNDFPCNVSWLSKDVKKENNPWTSPLLSEVPSVILPSKSNVQFMNVVVRNNTEDKPAPSDIFKKHNQTQMNDLIKLRPVVQFKIKSNKKLLYLPLHSTFQERCPQKTHQSSTYENCKDFDGERVLKELKESLTNSLKGETMPMGSTYSRIEDDC
ncbi:hypothetical protein SAY87_016550 [Trapa incisa]|uniref:Bromodomain associated domain-containing protein n=1 Tax=Trapa incisa TaxID=236973 RepID=A0AAN7L9G2_9MYRT|nr:hypothetical protein SAY87_016550 [Trapa incisa]